MISFVWITDEEKSKIQNSNWRNIPGQPYEIKVSGEFGSGKQIL